MSKHHITDDLLALGVRRGGVLLVHAALRSLGALPGGAETVIRELLAALGADGTLLMPALSYATVGKTNPIFDVAQTPSCVGTLPEYFRTRPGTRRSVHPTHSVCGVGKLAVDLMTNHDLDTTPCGPHSPFSKLPRVGGQILFLGCGLRPNTSLHAIEEQVMPPYLFGESIEYKIIMPDNSEKSMKVRGHNFVGYIQRYDRVEAIMDGKDIRQGGVLQAECYLLQTDAMGKAALTALERDPLCFVENAAS